MDADKLRPRATGLITAVWAAQAVIAPAWVASSLVEGATSWVWPFGLAWLMVGVVLAVRARLRWVRTDDHGIAVRSGFGPPWSWAWADIADVTADPPGPLVTHLAVVSHAGRVAETPLAKGDTRLHQRWTKHVSAQTQTEV
ncbi:MAG TPA: hypothetical protein VJ976_07235 [Ornithinimicrobium sp.]|uniref:hypothetical protein n=1 Tax=Ornithinimicrobium sp. TaxID=1977084 RepID=UPI002B49F5EB|nr:hypothetical protein [Ornithinimicrobium sp.]HKJ12169.1 hypothetical protein [Ornithinimicrobium sp.]